MNDKGVCRTALSTPGPLTTCKVKDKNLARNGAWNFFKACAQA